MKKAYQYILKSFVGPMVLAFLIVLFILIMQGLWKYIDELVGKGLETSVIFEFMFWLSVTLIPMALPLSILFASIMTMGNLGGNNELLALKSAGLSLTKILRPMFLVIILISGFAYYVANNLMPYSNLRIKSLFYDIKRKRPDAQIVDGVFSTLENYVIKVGSKDPKTNKLEGILLYEHPSDKNGMTKGNVILTVADSGYIKTIDDNMYVTLYNGVSYEDETYTNFNTPKNPFVFQKRRFDRQEVVIDLSGDKFSRTDMDLFKGQSYSFMTSPQLNQVVDSLSSIDTVRRDRFWINYKESMLFDAKNEIDTVFAALKINKEPKTSNTINIDSMYNKMSRESKRGVITYALGKMESSIQTVVGSSIELDINQQNIRKAKAEWHNKWTMSIACFIFFLVGAPLGAIIRKGGLGAPTVASLFLFILYYIISTITRKMAIQGAYPVAAAMWFPNILFLPLGLFLLYKSTTDSALFDADKYLRVFKRMFRIEDKSNYHAPSEMITKVAVPETLMAMLESFDNQTQTMINKASSKDLQINNIEEYYGNYDKLLCQLWGLQNEGLNEKLKDYPEIDLKIQGTRIPILKQMSRKLLKKKLAKISDNNSYIQQLLRKIFSKLEADDANA